MVSFARQLHDLRIIVAFCRWPAYLLPQDGTLGVPATYWGDTYLDIPDEFYATIQIPWRFRKRFRWAENARRADL